MTIVQFPHPRDEHEYSRLEKANDIKEWNGSEKARKMNRHTRNFIHASGETERIKIKDEERFCFYVARTAKELQIVGSEMHNCVGWGYENSVRKRLATIIYAKFRNKYKICIEVTPTFTIRQSLGPSNQPLEGDALNAYHEWCQEKHIRFEKAFSIHLAP